MHTVKINGARLVGVDLGDDVDQLLVGQLVVHGGQDLLQRCGRNEAVAYKKKDKNPINTLITANFAELRMRMSATVCCCCCCCVDFIPFFISNSVHRISGSITRKAKGYTLRVKHNATYNVGVLLAGKLFTQFACVCVCLFFCS